MKIIGAEPAGADDAAQSKLAGYIIPMLHPDTIADGLRASLGDLTWYDSMSEFLFCQMFLFQWMHDMWQKLSCRLGALFVSEP